MNLYGTGGHAKVILTILQTCGIPVTAFFDDNLQKEIAYGYDVYPYSRELFRDEPVIIAVGNNFTRRRIASETSHSFGSVTHPSATVETNVRIGSGVVITHRAIIQTGVIIGDHVIINTGTIIDHDCIIGDFVHIAPGTILCGSVQIGANTLIGAGSTIVPNVRVGQNCIIGAGSVVTVDIPDNVTAYGNPCRIIK
jgi:sugar O-acyltransferase (sialic acid O-acetyltransferase NeuD family)